jgi:hypothetical protein
MEQSALHSSHNSRGEHRKGKQIKIRKKKKNESERIVKVVVLMKYQRFLIITKIDKF